MNDPHRKRSRFDRTEPEPRQPDRVDRRSRSPTRPAEGIGARSYPVFSQDLGDTRYEDPASAAAVTAARISSQLQSRKPPMNHSLPQKPTPRSPSIHTEVYTQGGDYIKDIEINDLRNKYTLTKGATQMMIKEETGADVTTRGEYYPDKSLATAARPPLYLHVTSTTKEGLEKAVVKIENLMKVELPNLVDERRFRRREPEQVERDEYGRRKWPDERIPIDLEPIPGFNLRAQVVGHCGAYVKHIQAETRCRVQIKGRGSGFTDPALGHESDEPMFLHVAGPNTQALEKAKELCEDLLQNVKKQYEAFKERSSNSYNRPGDPERDYSREQPHDGVGRGSFHPGGYGLSHQNPSYIHHRTSGPQTGGGPPGTSPTANPSGASDSTPGFSGDSMDVQNSQYGQYYSGMRGQDPYVAWGGYHNYLAAYFQYYSQHPQVQQFADANGPGVDPNVNSNLSLRTPSGPGMTDQADPPPPPPPSEEPPPPPPPPDNLNQPGVLALGMIVSPLGSKGR